MDSSEWSLCICREFDEALCERSVYTDKPAASTVFLARWRQRFAGGNDPSVGQYR